MVLNARLENQMGQDGPQQMTQQAREIFNRKYGELLKARTLSDIETRATGLYSFANTAGDEKAVTAATRI